MNIGELIGGSAVLIATMAALSTPTFAGSYGPTVWMEPPVARPSTHPCSIPVEFRPLNCGGENSASRDVGVSVPSPKDRTSPPKGGGAQEPPTTRTRQLPKCESCEIETERRERNRQEWLDRGRQPPANGKPGRGDGKGWDRAKEYRERCL